MVGEENATCLAAVDRVVQSSAFRQSEILPRLLRYLADKAVDGMADQLKEYTIGIEALGKPSTYDPRQDSAVRIHVGRLRQRLDEYYRAEGKNDPVLMYLPKGHFKLNFEVRNQSAPDVAPPVSAVETASFVGNTRSTSVRLLIAALVVASGYALWSTTRLLSEPRNSTPATGYWNREMNDLWRPFLVPGHQVIIATAYPLFIGLQGAGFYRDPSVDSLDQANGSPRLTAVRKALGNPAILARHTYTSAGDANALFMLGRIFSVRDVNVSLVKSEDLTWQQLADNSIVMVGGPQFFASLLKGLPSALSYSLEQDGLRLLHPNPGEPEQMPDHYTPVTRIVPERRDHSGEPYAYALITHIPGPLGRSDILSFSSNRNAGTLAAVEWFTNPDLVRVLASKIKKSTGTLPLFYQIVLKVRYQDAVPTDVSMVAHAEIQNPPAR
jgi:hypothetical protein